MGAPTSSPVRLLVLTTSWPRTPDDPSGAFVRELAEALEPHGVRSTVVALDSPEGGALAAWREGRWPLLVRRVASMALHAGRVRDVDGVLAHWLLPSAVVGLGLGLRRPVVGVAHGSDVGLLARMPWVRRALVDRLAGVVAVSGAAAQSLGARRTLVAPMGVHASDIGPPAAMPPGPLRLLFLGRLVPQKGLGTLLEAVRGLPHVRLTVAGDGLDRRLAASAASNVRFVGAVPLSARKALLAEHHVVCVPSVGDEGAPRVVAEARAAGRPVLASRVGGLPDVVPAPWLVRAGDVGAWRAAILARSEAPQSLRPHGQPEDVDWRPVAARVAGFLERVIGR